MPLDIVKTYSPGSILLAANGLPLYSPALMEQVVDAVSLLAGGYVKTYSPDGVLLAVDGLDVHSRQLMENIIDSVNAGIKTMDPAGALLAVDGLDFGTPQFIEHLLDAAVTATAWSIDAASGKAVPATNAEWAALLTAAGVSSGGPVSIYLMQDAAAALADVNGTHNLPETAEGVYLYRQPVTGWTRLGAGHTYSDGLDTGWVKQHGTLPNNATNSYLLFGYFAITAEPSADAGIASVNDSALAMGVKTSTKRPLIKYGSESSVGRDTLPLNTVQPFVLKYDIANQVQKLYTLNQQLQVSYVAQSANTPEVDLNGVALASGLYAATGVQVYGALFIGAAAEKTDTEIGDMLTAMSWSPTWAATPVADNSKFFPLGTQQWEALGITAPNFAWDMQDTAGFLSADYIGNTFLLQSSGYTNYDKITKGATSVGFTRKASSFTDTFGAQVLLSTASALPDLSTTSMAMLMWVNVTNIGSDPFPTYGNWLGGMGLNQNLAIHMLATGAFGFENVAAHYNGSVDQRNVNGPVLFVYDITNSRLVLYTTGEKIVAGAFAAIGSGKGIFIGSSSAIIPVPAMTVSHVAAWKGANAEINDATARALFAALGVTVSW